LGTGVADSYAVVVFWQSVLTAKLPAAERTAKRHHGFRTALLALHDYLTPSIDNAGVSYIFTPQYSIDIPANWQIAKPVSTKSKPHISAGSFCMRIF
jgi:transposase